ncbi:MAG: 30S ribosomal protein S16 [Candidatus Pacebacteria bacterium]|nr:30S ribosomal protein S16 [Candidatus Paceibacterota bacterium]
MLMLRLQRIGRRNEAHFKIVVIEKTKGPKSQKYVDIVGSYNPKMGTIQMDEAKVKTHLANGVQPSDTVYNMLVSKGLVEGRKKNVLPKKSPVIDEEKLAREKEEAEAKAQAEKEAAEAKEAEANTEEASPEAEPEEATEAPAEEETPETVEEPSADELEAASEGAPEEATKTEE